MDHFDIVIVGAGLSGIGAARRIQDDCPGKSFAILEARSSIGGTWDLFRYPGIRSDSDMYTMGYDSKPWIEPKAIADGPSILSYVNEAAIERDIVRHIRFGHSVKSASWSSEQARWTVTAEVMHGESTAHISCNMLFMCSGYYSYENGYIPDIEGLATFRGPVVHPQKWPAQLDFSGRHVVVVGNGNDTCSGHGKNCRARHNAAALTYLRGFVTRTRSNRQTTSICSAAEAGFQTGTLEEYSVSAILLQTDARQSGQDKAHVATPRP